MKRWVLFRCRPRRGYALPLGYDTCSLIWRSAAGASTRDLKLSRLRPWQTSQLSPVEQEFFDRHSVRTDLAFEAQQVVQQAGQGALPGVSTQTEDLGFAQVTRIEIESDHGAAMMGKAKGRYVTIYAPGLKKRDRTLEQDISETLAKEIETYLARFGIGPEATILVIGLGNWNATPDNVGPLTISKLLVTRHLYEYQALTEEILGQMRPVAALSPGVLGLTGMETAEIVQAVVERVQPAAVICVDALASMSVERIGTTVQVSDAGISPGSGVGNTRKGLSRETLGVPVLAMGVPTVIYVTTIVSDAVDQLLAGATAPQEEAPGGPLLDPNRIVVTATDRSDVGPVNASAQAGGPRPPHARPRSRQPPQSDPPGTRRFDGDAYRHAQRGGRDGRHPFRHSLRRPQRGAPSRHLRRGGGANPLIQSRESLRRAADHCCNLTTVRNPSISAAICSATAEGSSPAQSLGKREAMTGLDRSLLDVGKGVVEGRAHGGSGPSTKRSSSLPGSPASSRQALQAEGWAGTAKRCAASQGPRRRLRCSARPWRPACDRPPGYSCWRKTTYPGPPPGGVPPIPLLKR